MPKVSVVMSVYNGERHLRQAVDSILNQSFSDFEFIVIDDGSTDRSAEILKSYEDCRMRILSQENIGLTRSLNRGIKLATGAYIARQDADDISEPDRFAKQVEVLDLAASTVLVSSNLRYFSEAWSSATESNRDIDPLFVRWLLLFYNHIGGHSQVMFRRSVAESLGGYNEAIRYSQDYDFWLRLSQCGEVVILPQVLLNFRHHDSNLSKVAASEQLSQSLRNSATFIAQVSGVYVSPDEVKMLRKFWLRSGGALSDSEATAVSLKLRDVLDGLFINGHVSTEQRLCIAKFVALFFDFSSSPKEEEPCPNSLASLALLWHDLAGSVNIDHLHHLSGKFV